MNSQSDLSFKALSWIEVKAGAGEPVSCYHQAGACILNCTNQPICSCGQPVGQLSSIKDPGAAIVCRSVYDGYGLPESQRRSTVRHKTLVTS